MLALVWQTDQEKENFEFKPAVLHLKLTLVTPFSWQRTWMNLNKHNQKNIV